MRNWITISLSKTLHSLFNQSNEVKVAQHFANTDTERMLSNGDDVKGLQSLQLGLRFYANAIDNTDLFEEAISCFQEAVGIKYLSHYVLHQEGCIYLYSEKKRDLDKAVALFEKAAKFARVDIISTTITFDLFHS